MVNPFANDNEHMQIIYLALDHAGCAQQEPHLGDVWLAAVQLCVTALRRLFDAASVLEGHIRMWKRRFTEKSNTSRCQSKAKPGQSKPSQLEDLTAPFQKAEVLKWVQRVVLSGLAQVQATSVALQMDDYFKGSRATHYLLKCSQLEQSRVLVRAATAAVGHTCSSIDNVLERLQKQISDIVTRPCDELGGFNSAVVAVLLKRKVLPSGFRPVYDDSEASQAPPEFTVATAWEAVHKLQSALDVLTVLPGPSAPAQASSTAEPEGISEGKTPWHAALNKHRELSGQPAQACPGPGQQGAAAGPSAPWPDTHKNKIVSVKAALSQAARQASRKSLLDLPEILVPDNRRMKRVKRAAIVLGGAWLVRHIVKVLKLARSVTTTVVVPQAAIYLPLKIKSLTQKAQVVDRRQLENEKMQLHRMEQEIMHTGKQLQHDTAKHLQEAVGPRINLGAPPSEVETDDDAELAMMHALHGASEAVEEGFMSKLSALSTLNPAHLMKVASFVLKRTKVQAQDMVLRLDNIARTNNLILSILTAAPPLLLSLLLHWCITRRLIWVNARPGSNFLLSLHAQMHVVGNALKAWGARPERSDLHGVFLYEVAKATRIGVKMLHRSRGVCHATLVTLLYDDMVAFSTPGTPEQKALQFEALMSTNPLLKDSA